MRLRLSLGAAVAVVISGLALLAGGLHEPQSARAGGTLLNVDTAVDEDVGNALCSLREAIIAANNNANYRGCTGLGFGFDGIEFSLGPGTPTINITASPLPAIIGPLSIDGGPDRVELRGPGGPFQAAFNGLTIASTAPGTTIRRLVINSFPAAGISVSANSVKIFGNRIGTDPTGTIAMPNTTGLSQLSGELFLVGSQTGTTPGGACTGDCNLISGNDGYGVHVNFQASTATVQFSFLGTNLAGDAALGNGLDGVATTGGSGHLVRNNVVSGNGERGTRLAGALVTATGNIMGANSAGDAAIPNGLSGLTLDSAGLATIRDNLLSGNGGDGLDIFLSSNVQVNQNRIGVAQDGATPLPNQGFGVRVGNATDIRIGDAADDDEGNTIAFNGGDGVSVDGQSGTTDAAIRGNSIHDNALSGIDNVNGGNTELAPPLITGLGSIHGTACPNCLIDVYSDNEDEGRIYEGTTTADGSGDWTFNDSLTGPFVTATAADAAGNTSEFSAPYDPTPPTPTPTPSPTPSVTPTSTLTPTPTATPTPTVTPPTPTPTPTPTASPTGTGGQLTQGDVDCNFNVSSVDALKELRHVAQLSVSQTEPCPNIGDDVASLWGDVDCNGGVTSVDALKILRYVAQLSVAQTEPCPDIGTPES